MGVFLQPMFCGFSGWYLNMGTQIITVVCAHCGNQMSHKVSSSGTLNVTCQMGRGGCGKSSRVCISSGQLNWVKK